MRAVRRREEVFDLVRLGRCAGVFAALWLGLASASARTVESVVPPNVRVFPLFDARLDFALRIEAINRAKYTIDVVVYMHTGELGTRMNEALQAAINRGVKVRFVTEGLTTIGPTKPLGSNLPRKLARTLTSNGACPSKILCISPYSKYKAGFHPFDSFHEKILRIDADTPYELVWLGGRNNDKFALGDLDFSVVMRPIDPSKPSAGAAVGEIYDEIFDTAEKIQTPKTTTVASDADALARNAVTPPDPKKLLEKSKLSDLNDFLAYSDQLFGAKEAAAGAHGIPSFQPERVAISSNQFFRQLEEQGASRAMSKRPGILNSNFDLLRDSVLKSKRIYVTSMAVDLPDEFRKLMRQAILNGSTVRFITNSPELEAARIPGAVQFDRSMKDLQELHELSQQPGVEGKLEIFLLDKEKIASSKQYGGWLNYVHRKVIVTDHGVFLGSDNYTDASRARNNEILTMLEDRKMVSFMDQHIGKELELFRPMPCSDLLFYANRTRDWARRVMAHMLRQFL